MVEEVSDREVMEDSQAGVSEVPDDPTFQDIAPAIEFCCWVVVALAPFLRWVNGAAVTQDQFYIQIALTTMAVVGAASLRIYNWRVVRREAERTQGDGTGEVAS